MVDFKDTPGDQAGASWVVADKDSHMERIHHRHSGLNPAAPEFVPAAHSSILQSDALQCFATLESTLISLQPDGDRYDEIQRPRFQQAVQSPHAAGGQSAPPRKAVFSTRGFASMIQNVRMQEINAAHCIQKAWRARVFQGGARPLVQRPRPKAAKSFRDVVLADRDSQKVAISKAVTTTMALDPWAAAADRKSSMVLDFTEDDLISKTHKGHIAEFIASKGHGLIRHQKIFDLTGRDIFFFGSDFPRARRAGDQITFRATYDRDGKLCARPAGKSAAKGRQAVECIPKNASAHEAWWGSESNASPWSLYIGCSGLGLGAANRSRPNSDRATLQAPLAIGPGRDVDELLAAELSGTIKEFHADGGYGFVRNERVRKFLSQDVFFLRGQFPECNVGAKVKFRLELDEAGRPRVKAEQNQDRYHHPSSSSSAPAKLELLADVGPDQSQLPESLTLEECLSCVHEGVIVDYDPVKARGFVRNQRVHRLFGKDVLFRKGQFAGQDVGNVVRFGVELDVDGRPRARDLAEVPDDELLTDELLLSRRHEGIIYQFSKDRGYGFVRNHAIHKYCGRDVFITSQHFAGREVGDAVTFAVELTSDGLPRARDVRNAGDLTDCSKDSARLTIKELLTQEHQGVIVQCKEDNSFGFITNQQIHMLCGHDVFFHKYQLSGKGVGDTVSFHVALDVQGRPHIRKNKVGKIVEHADALSEVQNRSRSADRRVGTRKGSERLWRSASSRCQSLGRECQPMRVKHAFKLLMSNSAITVLFGTETSVTSPLTLAPGVQFSFTARSDCYPGTTCRVVIATADTEEPLKEALQQIVSAIAAELDQKTPAAKDFQLHALVPIGAVPYLTGVDGLGLQELTDAIGATALIDPRIVGEGPGREQILTLSGDEATLRASIAWLVRRVHHLREEVWFDQWALRTNTPSDPHLVQSAGVPTSGDKAASKTGPDAHRRALEKQCYGEHDENTGDLELNVVLGSDFGHAGLRFQTEHPLEVEGFDLDVQEFWEQCQSIRIGDKLIKINGRLLEGRLPSKVLQELKGCPMLLTFYRSAHNRNTICFPAQNNNTWVRPQSEAPLPDSQNADDKKSREHWSNWYDGAWSKWQSGDSWRTWSPNTWGCRSWSWNANETDGGAYCSWGRRWGPQEFPREDLLRQDTVSEVPHPSGPRSDCT